jgi:PAS domain-containing protein
MRLLPEALFLTETRAGMQTAIFAKEAFLQLSGYSMAEVLDHDLSFLQSTDTDPLSFVQFLQLLQIEQISEHEMVLYKKDGTPFGDRVSKRAFRFMSGYSHDSRVQDAEVSHFFCKPFFSGSCRSQDWETFTGYNQRMTFRPGER